MVSIIILAIAILPMVGMFDMGLNGVTASSNYDKARTLANLKLEQAKSLPFTRPSKTTFRARRRRSRRRLGPGSRSRVTTSGSLGTPGPARRLQAGLRAAAHGARWGPYRSRSPFEPYRLSANRYGRWSRSQ